MLCFFAAGVAVLAVPKTGTVALETMLGRHADLNLYLRQPRHDKHMTCREFAATLAPEIRPKCKRPIKVFAVLREPLDWIGSWYRFRQRDGVPDPRNSIRGISFEDFGRSYCCPARPSWADLPPQIDFLQAEAGGIGPDHLFHYEDHQPCSPWRKAGDRDPAAPASMSRPPFRCGAVWSFRRRPWPGCTPTAPQISRCTGGFRRGARRGAGRQRIGSPLLSIEMIGSFLPAGHFYIAQYQLVTLEMQTIRNDNSST